MQSVFCVFWNMICLQHVLPSASNALIDMHLNWPSNRKPHQTQSISTCSCISFIPPETFFKHFGTWLWVVLDGLPVFLQLHVSFTCTTNLNLHEFSLVGLLWVRAPSSSLCLLEVWLSFLSRCVLHSDSLVPFSPADYRPSWNRQ